MTVRRKSKRHRRSPRRRATLSWRRQQRTFERSAGQLFRGLKSAFALTLGAPFRWCWRWLTSRDLKLVLRALPALGLCLGVLVLFLEARRAESSQLAISYRQAAQQAIDDEDAASAILWLEQAVELQPYDEELVFALARLRLKEGDQARGLTLIQRIAPDDRPDYPEAHLWVATHLEANSAEIDGQLATRLKHHLLQGTRSQRTPDAAHGRLGILLSELGDQDAALVHLKQAALIAPMWALDLARLQADIGDLRAAVKSLEQARLHFKRQAIANPADSNAWLD